MIDKRKLAIGQSYNIFVPDWDKFKSACLKDDSLKPSISRYQANTPLVFVMDNFRCGRIEILKNSDNKQDSEDKDNAEQWILKLNKEINVEKCFMFYDPSEDRFMYAKECDFEVKEALTLPAVYTFERINEANFNRLAYALNATQTKVDAFNFYFSKKDNVSFDLFWEKLLNFIFPYNKVRSGGKFLIQNQDGSFDGEELDKEILSFLQGQSHEKFYRTIISYKKKKYKVFPVNDWQIIDSAPDNRVVIGGGKRGIILYSKKLDIYIAISGWNFSKLLINGFVINGKLLGSYGIILHNGETTLLLPENGKIFKQLRIADKERGGLFDDLITENSPVLEKTEEQK